MTPIKLNQRQYTCINMKEFVKVEERNALKQANTKLLQENGTIKQELETLKQECRRNIITALTEGIRYKDAETRNDVVDSFHRSKLSIEEINGLLEPLRQITAVQDKRVIGIE
jgi:hypothetical protein